MGQIKWLGDGTEDSPEETTGFRGLVMKKDEWVDCDDPDILARASRNQKFFEVEGYEPKEGETPTYDVTKEVTMPPPSQQTAQYPMPKHGDTKTLEATLPNPPDPIIPDPPPERARLAGIPPVPSKV